ncbi:MAG TPA: UDP-N-acetylglucosamine 2-epimerase (non-hydrolyzing) [Geminicoccaceae bacterium]
MSDFPTANSELPRPGGATILCVAGARPNFIKVAPIVAALRTRPAVRVSLVHTGQHYDAAMNDVFFEDLGIPKPDVALDVGSGSHAVQTAAIMQGIEPVMDTVAPRLVLVVGDVNSTLAAALVAAKKGIAVAHVEAGLRSFDRRMPEEINRVLTDQISDLLFTTERTAESHLRREGVAPERIYFVGNVMIDSLRQSLGRAVPAAQTLAEAGAPPRFCAGYALLTLHRPSNVDDPDVLAALLDTLLDVSKRLPIVFPAHPRTAARIAAAGLEARLDPNRIFRLPPMGYLATLGLMRAARVVLTDSGGMQEETTALGVPCLTLRENTERPITVSEGTNIVVGTDRARILAAVEDVLQNGGKAGRVPELWDGRAAERIADHLCEWLRSSRPDLAGL